MAWLNAGLYRRDIVTGVVRHQWVALQPSGAVFSNDHNDANVYLHGAVVDPLIAVYNDIQNLAGAANHPLNGRLGEYVSVATATAAPTAGAGAVPSPVVAVQRGHKMVVPNTVGKSIAEWDDRTGKTVALGVSLGTHANWETAWVAIQAALAGTASDVRGIGPFNDGAGGIWRIRLPDYTVMYTPPGGVEAPHPAGGWGYELARKATHPAGRMHHHGPYTKNWMYPDAGEWPEYDPATYGLTGVKADGRNPLNNALPPTDSADGTFGTTVDYYGATWTIEAGTFKVLRDGVPFQDHIAENFLVHEELSVTHLFWVTDVGDWWFFVPGNGVGYHGTIDPRTPPPEPGDGPFFDFEGTASMALGSDRITGLGTPEYNAIPLNTWVTLQITYPMVRGYGEGPGGSFPRRSVASVGALGSGGAGEVKYITSTKEVYRCNGGSSWSRVLDDGIMGNGYAYGLNLPRTMHGKVVSKSGGDLFLVDRNGVPVVCKAAVSGAKLHVNNIAILEAIIANLASGVTDYQLPNMQLPGAGVCRIDRSNFTLWGGGYTSSGFWSPRGVAPAGIELQPTRSSFIARDFKLKGNHGDNYYGLNYADEGPSVGFLQNASTPGGVTDFGVPQGSWIPSGIMLRGNGTNGGCATYDMWVEDILNIAIGAAFHNDSWHYRPHIRINSPTYFYGGWITQLTDCNGGGVVGLDFSSPYAQQALETFKSTGTLFQNCVLQNGHIAFNSSAGRLESPRITWTADSCVPNAYPNARHQCIDVNQSVAGGYTSGVRIVDSDIRILGYVRGGCATKRGITSWPQCNLRVEGAYHQSPDYNSAVESLPTDPDGSSQPYLSGACAMNAENVDFGGVRCVGLSKHYHNWAGAWQNASIRGTNGSSQISGFGANQSDPRNVVTHGAEDIETW